MNTPTVSIIMAAYGRPAILPWAVRSVQRQTLQDWELVVVGDACERTGEVMESFSAGDSRICLINLARNHGDQSGPNNVGVQRSTGRYIAYLNQDDLWFPDHLRVLVDWLEGNGGDFVFGLSAHIGSVTSTDLDHGRWHGGLVGLCEPGGYKLVNSFSPDVISPASAWLLSRDCVCVTGLWHPGRECVGEPSQEFLFRAWRRRQRLLSCPELTTLVFSSGSRPGSYISPDSCEQEWFDARMGEYPKLRALVLGHVSDVRARPPGLRARVVEPVKTILGTVLAHIGISPRALRMRWRKGFRPGQYIDRLRRIRGLPGMGNRWSLTGLRWQAVARACTCWPGQFVDFRGTGDGTRLQLRGWSQAEDWGTWTEGPCAELLMRISPQDDTGMQMNLVAKPYLDFTCTRQRVEVQVQNQPWMCFLLSRPEFVELNIPLSANHLSGQQEPLSISLLLPDCTSPRSAGVSGDRRLLGLGVASVTIDTISQPSQNRATKTPKPA